MFENTIQSEVLTEDVWVGESDVLAQDMNALAPQEPCECVFNVAANCRNCELVSGGFDCTQDNDFTFFTRCCSCP